MRSIWLFLLLAGLGTLDIGAQPVIIQAQFHQDSVKIGEPVGYSVWVDYPRGSDIIFPDSTFDFSPFEFYRKVFFQTHSDSLSSQDSVVYFVTTFEIDQIQALAIPIFKVNGGDSLTYTPELDSVYLVELIPGEPTDTLQVQANTSFKDVVLEFNYPYWILGLIILAVLAGVVVLVFGRAIRKRFQLYRLAKNHNRFITQFDKLIAELKISGNQMKAEEALVAWKRYMERLESIPYTKLTTKEIVLTSQNEHLKKPLREVDQGIYGDTDLDSIYESFENLEYISVERFQQKVDRTKNS